MASLVIGYNVEYAADRAMTEAFLARARALHADLAAPCTLYLREDIVREYAAEAPAETAALEKQMQDVMSSDNWKWSLNQEDPGVKQERAARQQEFVDRYK